MNKIRRLLESRKSVIKEAMWLELESQGKSIKLPIREKDFVRTKTYHEQLIKRGALNKKCSKKTLDELWSRTLDDNTYEMFCRCLSL